MFADFLKKLTAPEPEQLPDSDARLALTALLVRVARSDGSYDLTERQRIARIAETRYGLSPDDATALRSDAEELEAQAPDTVRFTRAIKDAVAYEDRIAVIEALWQVVLADGRPSACRCTIGPRREKPPRPSGGRSGRTSQYAPPAWMRCPTACGSRQTRWRIGATPR